uniref:Uncharacterized protein n=1 Tax=Kalanchoe fedtschenkoi TaxID=63787 RepID=A0A7N0TEV9_KALFE
MRHVRTISQHWRHDIQNRKNSSLHTQTSSSVILATQRVGQLVALPSCLPSPRTQPPHLLSLNLDKALTKRGLLLWPCSASLLLHFPGGRRRQVVLHPRTLFRSSRDRARENASLRRLESIYLSPFVKTSTWLQLSSLSPRSIMPFSLHNIWLASSNQPGSARHVSVPASDLPCLATTPSLSWTLTKLYAQFSLRPCAQCSPRSRAPTPSVPSSPSVQLVKRPMLT